VDISDLAGVVRVARGKGALRPQDRGEGSIEVAVEQRGFGFNERQKLVEEMARHAIDREPPKNNSRGEFDNKSVIQRLRISVGRNYLAEELVRLALRLFVVCVRHRVNKPSLSFWLVGSGWRLATLHGKRAGFPVRSRWSAAGRNKKAARLVACNFRDLERVGYSLPWEEGEEQKVV